MKQVTTDLACDECGQQDIQSTQTYNVYKCLHCGAYFEGEDAPPRKVRRTRPRDDFDEE